MVAVTGDLVDGSVQRARARTSRRWRALRSRHGTFFVTGNHEYYCGADDWIAELRRLGVRVLLNEHVVLEHDGAQPGDGRRDRLQRAPLRPAHRSDPQRAIAGAPADAGCSVLLAHQPRSADAAAQAGFDLQLSGHTHGGQFWPWNLFVRLQQPFTAGLHRLQQLWVYTSRGTGYWGPPMRFGAPSRDHAAAVRGRWLRGLKAAPACPRGPAAAARRCPSAAGTRWSSSCRRRSPSASRR